MKTLLLPALAALALLGASFEASAHNDGYRERYHEPPRYGHYKPKHHRHHGASYRAPVVVIPAPRHHGYYDRRSYRPGYHHDHHARCGHHGYRDTRGYGIAFGVTPYDTWVDVRVGY